MDFDELRERRLERQQEKNGQQDIISETIAVGNNLLNTDYLAQISKIKKLKEYIKDCKDMNLAKRGWGFQFGSSREWAGLCSANPNFTGKAKAKNIFVSIQFTKHDLNWKENMSEVILHEIAHGIVFEIFYFDKKNTMHDLHKIDDVHRATEGHGIIWGLVCGALKGSKERCRIKLENANLSDSFKAYKYECFNCDKTEYGSNPYFAQKCKHCRQEIIIELNKD